MGERGSWWRRFSEGEAVCVAPGRGWLHHAPKGGKKGGKGEPALVVAKKAGGGSKGTIMPTYVILMNWTAQGARADWDAVRRREHADAVAEKHAARR